jgi:predicted Ser/Thr protein kinase
MGTEAPSILPSMHAVSAGWNSWAPEKKFEQPLRNKLTSFVFDTLHERVKQLQTEDGAKVAISQGVAIIRGDTLYMPYLQYNQTTKKTEVDDSKEAVPLQDVLERISAIKEVTSQRDTITRFIPSRRLAAEMKGGPVRFLIQLPAGGAGKTDALHNHLRHLNGHSAFVLIGATLSPGSQRRSPLAKQLEKALRKEGV